MPKPKKKPTITKLKKKAWTLFSKYIRLKYADDNGYVQCVTCKCIKHWKEMQAGHYISRRFSFYLFSETNVFPQCVACNMFNKGELGKYCLFLQGKYGKEWVDERTNTAPPIKQFKRPELEIIIESLKQKLNEHI